MTARTITILALFAFGAVGMGVAAYIYYGPFMAMFAALLVVGAGWEAVHRRGPDS